MLLQPNRPLYTLPAMLESVRNGRRFCCAVVGLTVLVIGLAACTTPYKPAPPAPISNGIQFTISLPEAQSVAVAGSFNGWAVDTHRMLRQGTNGVWSVVIALPEGEHAFMYVINGKTWMAPPAAQDFVTDGFGNTNGIVVVR